MKKKLFALTLAVLLAASVLACSAPKSSGKYDSATEYAAEREVYYSGNGYAMDEGMPMEMADASVVNTTKAQSETMRQDTGRKLIRDANLSMETKEFDRTVPRIEEQVSQFGGYIERMEESGNSYRSTSRRSAYFTARIPSDQLDDFLNIVDGLGNVTRKNLSTRDVTSNYVDIESRLKVLETEKESLQKIMASAENTVDMLETQSRLYDVIEEIEAYEAQKRTYDSLIAFSTVTIDVQEVVELTPPKEETRWEEFTRRFATSLADLGEAIVDFCIGFVVALPWLLVLGVVIAGITLAIVLPIRAKRRKRRAAKEKEAQSAQEAK